MTSGAARVDHLPGTAMPAVRLPSTGGGLVDVGQVPPGHEWLVLYVHPGIARPGVPLPPGWDDIPGARGCTAESCGFRDHAEELRRLGCAVVGVSVQDTAAQREAVERLRLPFPLLSDEDGRLAAALRLPTFEVAGQTLLERMTLLVRLGPAGSAVVARVYYPITDPGGHAAEVLGTLSA